MESESDCTAKSERTGQESSSPRSSLASTAVALGYEKHGARLNRSPGIKILEMASKEKEFQSKFCAKDFRLRHQSFLEEASDEYDTDLEADEVNFLVFDSFVYRLRLICSALRCHVSLLSS